MWQVLHAFIFLPREDIPSFQDVYHVWWLLCGWKIATTVSVVNFLIIFISAPHPHPTLWRMFAEQRDCFLFDSGVRRNQWLQDMFRKTKPGTVWESDVRRLQSWGHGSPEGQTCRGVVSSSGRSPAVEEEQKRKDYNVTETKLAWIPVQPVQPCTKYWSMCLQESAMGYQASHLGSKTFSELSVSFRRKFKVFGTALWSPARSLVSCLPTVVYCSLLTLVRPMSQAPQTFFQTWIPLLGFLLQTASLSPPSSTISLL